jgi:hypothetical protein
LAEHPEYVHVVRQSIEQDVVAVAVSVAVGDFTAGTTASRWVKRCSSCQRAVWPSASPIETPNIVTADHVVSRGSYADLGPSGLRRCNPLVTVGALAVLREDRRSPSRPCPEA